MPPIIQVRNLRKSCGSILAADDISFQVQRGEIFGLLGPNGAGKTTTLECLEGIRQPDRGESTSFRSRKACRCLRSAAPSVRRPGPRAETSAASL
jgi:ABC-type multidrug transport system ATPase subunit